MFSTTLSHLQCPRCTGPLASQTFSATGSPTDIQFGNLLCKSCSVKFPILAGIAILVEDPQEYLISHVKGISKIVKDEDIPREYRKAFARAKATIAIEHIEEDLEADRVNALYLMNHYLNTQTKTSCHSPCHSLWWNNDASPNALPSLLISQLVRDYWDQGPFSQIENWLAANPSDVEHSDILELGCGVGGLHRRVRPFGRTYLGVDSSFASIALARHLNLGVPYPTPLRFPADLLQGSLSREIQIPRSITRDGHSDFVVSDVQNPGIRPGWQLLLSLNMIDMLDRPQDFPQQVARLLLPQGITIQSCPYIWHDRVARALRKILPSQLKSDSAQAIEWLFHQEGFTIEKSVRHLPWLFFKHLRQLEVYSVHLFSARKADIPQSKNISQRVRRQRP